MEKLFITSETVGFDDLDMRVYTSRLLGQSKELVLHGGGNTSVKIDDILYVKGSGWNLDTIERGGFAPVYTDAIIKLLENETLSDADMVRAQKEAMCDKTAPAPSIEAILHAFIPFKFVDHTHTDAVVTLTNTAKGEAIIKELYGENMLIIPYVMPGFVLAKKIYEMTRGIDWKKLDGMVLLNHGVFTFSDDAQEAYEKMIDIVTEAEDYLQTHAPLKFDPKKTKNYDIVILQREISDIKGYDCVVKLNTSEIAQAFASDEHMHLPSKPLLTPEHIIRTKRLPMICNNDHYDVAINAYMHSYMAYYNRNATDEIMLNSAPNWAILKGLGTVSFGKNEKEASIIEDINNHTMLAWMRGAKLGGFESLSEKDSFAMEYWELEQAKLKG